MYAYVCKCDAKLGHFLEVDTIDIHARTLLLMSEPSQRQGILGCHCLKTLPRPGILLEFQDFMESLQ